MGKRSRQRVQRQLPPPAAGARRATPRPPTAPAAPERLLLEAIAAGELDDHLAALGDAIHARHHLVQTVRSATALAGLCVGDQVRINHTISPRYLHGLQGRIVELDDERATVCLHRPVGRFHSGEIRCPPLTLDKLPKAS
ncbi:MAG: hypothetical protein LC790_02520 [Actinobacteria bacterium]|nr:hypothetical protein [Actinomycetota bacterium]